LGLGSGVFRSPVGGPKCPRLPTGYKFGGEAQNEVMVLEKFTPVDWIALERDNQRTSNWSLSRRPADSIVADDLDPDEFVPTS